MKSLFFALLTFIQALLYVSCMSSEDNSVMEWESSNTLQHLEGKAFVVDSVQFVSSEFKESGIFGGPRPYIIQFYTLELQLFFNNGKLFVEPDFFQHGLNNKAFYLPDHYYGTYFGYHYETFIVFYEYYRKLNQYWWLEIGDYSINPLTNEVEVKLKPEYDLDPTFDEAVWPTKCKIANIGNQSLELIQTSESKNLQQLKDEGKYWIKYVQHVYLQEIKDHSNFVCFRSEQEMIDYVAPYYQKAIEEYCNGR